MSKLSEEEKKAIDKLKRSANYFVMPIYETKIILNLIEKQQKEISLLKEQLEYVKSEYEETIEQQQKEIEELKEKSMHITKETVEFVNSHYIHNDKIKSKIEECREILYSFEKELELKGNKNKFIHKESMNCLLGQISILQSLLEEEQK